MLSEEWESFEKSYICIRWLTKEYIYTQSNLAIRNGLIRNLLILRNHFPWPICHLLHKDKEHLASRNNFRVTRKFLIAKFDYILKRQAGWGWVDKGAKLEQNSFHRFWAWAQPNVREQDHECQWMDYKCIPNYLWRNKTSERITTHYTRVWMACLCTIWLIEYFSWHAYIP